MTSYVILRLLEDSNNVWVQFTAMTGRSRIDAIHKATVRFSTARFRPFPLLSGTEHW